MKRRTPTQLRLPSRYCANCPMRREQRDEISIFAYICAQRSAVEYRHLISAGGGGELPYEKDGDARRKIRIKPLKETNLGVAQALFQI